PGSNPGGAIDAGPELQGFEHGHARANRIAMAAIMDRRPGFLGMAGYRNRALDRVEQTRKGKEQRRFARAVGTAQQEPAAGGHAQRQIARQNGVAPPEAKRLSVKAEFGKDLPLRHGPISY